MTSATPQLRFVEVYRGVSGPTRMVGRGADSTHETRRYFQRRVRERLRAASSERRVEAYVEELRATGFAVDSIAAAIEKEPRIEPWEVGEALAETLLEDYEDAYFPWPPAWDKRTESASLQGPDLVGLHKPVAGPRLLFGEVKTSADANAPPTVAYELRDQLLRIIKSEGRRRTLLAWLSVRAQNRDWQDAFNTALAAYLREPAEASVIGVLLRDTTADRKDLEVVKSALDDTQTSFARVAVAFYFPIRIADWPSAVEGTEDAP